MGVFCMHVYMCFTCTSGAYGGQKRVSDFLELEIYMVVKPPCGCWDLNSGSLEKQLMCLTAEPSLYPSPQLVKWGIWLCCTG